MIKKDNIWQLATLMLLTFWGLWYLLVFSTNLFDFINAFFPFSDSFRYRSGNYSAMLGALAIYNTPRFVLNSLFFINITAQLCMALAFLISAWRYVKGKLMQTVTYVTFLMNIAFWMIFILADELLMAYHYEATHVHLLIVSLLSLMMACGVASTVRSGSQPQA